MTDFAAARTAMVDCQVRPSDVTLYPIIDALLSVRREVFVPAALQAVAYSGGMIDLGEGRIVLEPRTFAKMLNALAVGPSDLVLDVGCGLGYSSAVLAHMAEAVVAIEADEAMANDAQQALSAESIDNVAVECHPLDQGAPSHGPYDAIAIQGGIEDLPDAIADQLKDGGRIAAIWMDGPVGCLRVGVKRGARIAWRNEFDATAPVLPGFAKEKAFRL